MPDLQANANVKQVQIAATVLRAVPCAAHHRYELGCPDCLTGEEAAARRVAQRSHDLGTISDSAWRRGDPRAWLAARRTRNANERAVEHDR